jgi:T6SS, Transcription factor, DNA binding domain/Proteobacterial transcriptional regulator-like domain
MTRADWRSPGAYEDLRSLDAPSFAWEYLRRNPEFQRHCKKLERAARQGALDQAEADAFARRWGLQFRERYQDKPAPLIIWSAPALPSVIALTKLPADLADPQFRLPPLALEAGLTVDGTEHLVECRGAVLRVHIDKGGIEPPSVLLPLDQLFEIRAIAAIRLWRCLTGRSLGPNPAALPKARRDRLILALRALDGRLADGTYREIAAGLFGAGDVSERGWKSHDLRDRTMRLVRFGRGMMQGDYRHLLLHPYRRRP